MQVRHASSKLQITQLGRANVSRCQSKRRGPKKGPLAWPYVQGGGFIPPSKPEKRKRKGGSARLYSTDPMPLSQIIFRKFHGWLCVAGAAAFHHRGGLFLVPLRKRIRAAAAGRAALVQDAASETGGKGDNLG